LDLLLSNKKLPEKILHGSEQTSHKTTSMDGIKYMKEWSTKLTFRKMQRRAIMKYHSAYITMSKKNANHPRNKSIRGCWEPPPFILL
jgi:hypothetical protein